MPAFPKLLYADRLTTSELAADDSILGVVGYGAVRPEFLPESCPFVAAPLAPVGGGEMFEVWMADAPVRLVRAGPVIGACGDSVAFGCVTLEEKTGTLEDSVEAAYLSVFDFLEAAGMPAPLRFWNYLGGLLEVEAGLQRYMRFNIGRHRAFSARLREAVPPAASCVGGHGESMVYFLAGREPARAVENPRQMSAYDYPPVYGPRSPGFSRAGVLPGALFISGTASIVGHETRHAGDLQGQIAETAENLRALIGAAGSADGAWAVKVYLHDPAGREAADAAVRSVFGGDAQVLCLQGDICRAELVVEIEAFRLSRV